MPELPEVESIRLVLEPLIVGKTVADVEVYREKNFSGEVDALKGKRIITTSRHGKYLHIVLSDNLVINIHLKMSGQIFFLDEDQTNLLIHNKKNASLILPNKHSRVMITFQDKTKMVFNDMRAFGYMRLNVSKERPLGLDLLHDRQNLHKIEKMIQKSARNIKTLLLDQSILAGLGNIYVCEVLFDAKISPFREGRMINSSEIKTLIASIEKIIDLALFHGGSSIKDETYVMPTGSQGGFQNFCKVYAHAGDPCLNCSNPVMRIKQNGRSTYYCETCQK